MKNLMKFTKTLAVIVTGTILLSSCATIVGGSKYYAHVEVDQNPNATITYKGSFKGKGNAIFRAPRREVDKFTVTVKEENCQEQTFNYKAKTFRGWSFLGTIVTWTSVTASGIPLPWGVAVDASTGAFFKPSVLENGINKLDYKNYQYKINYTGCQVSESNQKVEINNNEN